MGMGVVGGLTPSASVGAEEEGAGIPVATAEVGAGAGGAGAGGAVSERSRLDGPGMADDTSVLPIPSHVVLHHLSTSAIRNGVLAVGNTTRYRKKVGFAFGLVFVSYVFWEGYWDWVVLPCVCFSFAFRVDL